MGLVRFSSLHPSLSSWRPSSRDYGQDPWFFAQKFAPSSPERLILLESFFCSLPRYHPHLHFRCPGDVRRVCWCQTTRVVGGFSLLEYRTLSRSYAHHDARHITYFG
ncbi:hypothetical protein C1H46_003758 [Malus baccata]|uniref:Uncharacterized protein n=1 Tax=Malus baccata TaxID=106549 RepID=A0A540NHW9_MALBA|nr:hypothetical protein C1H46_003758 [Malus baccata]